MAAIWSNTDEGVRRRGEGEEEEEQRVWRRQALCRTAAEPDRRQAALSDSEAHQRAQQISSRTPLLREEKRQIVIIIKMYRTINFELLIRTEQA